MNISNFPSSTYTSSLYASGDPNQARTDLQTLNQALQSGDLASAQKAYTQLQTDAPWWANASSTSGSPNPAADNFTALGNSLQSGDLTGAQSAFGKFLLAIRNQSAGADGQSALGGNQADAQSEAFRSLATALQGGDLNAAQEALTAFGQASGTTDQSNGMFANLTTALQAGDLGGAQTAFDAFVQSQLNQNSLPLYGADGTGGTVNSGATSGLMIDAMA